MTKRKIAMTDVTGFNKVFRAGYCDLQYIYKYHDPQFYNAGVYGWNCDIYIDYSRDIAITTGYRNMRGECIPGDILKKYTAIAKEILENNRFSNFKEVEKQLAANIENFLDELDAL